MSDQNPLAVILSQIDGAKEELDAYPPVEFDWYIRSQEAANLLLPWLGEIAPELKEYVEEVMNSPVLIRESWAEIKSAAGKSIPKNLLALMDRELEREAILLDYVGGEVMSSVISKHLIDSCSIGELESNGRSDYPDLFMRSRDYEGLPTFKKITGKSQKYGAAIKGRKRRPVRIPDGLEIKTCRNRFGVDCHHAHAGLHLVVLVDTREEKCRVIDIMAAFMRHDFYRITKPSTPTTTLKASFNGDNFVSLLPSTE